MQATHVQIGSSRLCPQFSSVISDPLLLTYFNQYLREIANENIFRFWVEVSGCISRRNETYEAPQPSSEAIPPSEQQLEILRDKMTRLPVNDVTTIYFRYLSGEAKLPVDIPLDLLCNLLCKVLL